MHVGSLHRSLHLCTSQEMIHSIHLTGLTSLANRTAKVFAYESAYWNLVRRCSLSDLTPLLTLRSKLAR